MQGLSLHVLDTGIPVHALLARAESFGIFFHLSFNIEYNFCQNSVTHLFINQGLSLARAEKAVG